MKITSILLLLLLIQIPNAISQEMKYSERAVGLTLINSMPWSKANSGFGIAGNYTFYPERKIDANLSIGYISYG